jgi:hypothetical protein
MTTPERWNSPVSTYTHNIRPDSGDVGRVHSAGPAQGTPADPLRLCRGAVRCEGPTTRESPNRRLFLLLLSIPAAIHDVDVGMSLLFGVVTSSALLLGASVGVRFELPKRVPAMILSFAAGGLITALTFELFQMPSSAAGFGSQRSVCSSVPSCSRS